MTKTRIAELTDTLRQVLHEQREMHTKLVLFIEAMTESLKDQHRTYLRVVNILEEMSKNGRFNE